MHGPKQLVYYLNIEAEKIYAAMLMLVRSAPARTHSRRVAAGPGPPAPFEASACFPGGGGGGGGGGVGGLKCVRF